jgi:hypothetical protein
VQGRVHVREHEFEGVDILDLALEERFDDLVGGGHGGGRSLGRTAAAVRVAADVLAMLPLGCCACDDAFAMLVGKVEVGWAAAAAAL